MEDAKRRILIRVIGAPLMITFFAFIVWVDYKTPSLLGISAIVFLLSIFSLNEFYALCVLKGYKPARNAGIIFAALSQPVILYGFEPLGIKGIGLLLTYSYTLLLIYIMVKLVVEYGKFSIIDAGLTLIGYLYIHQLSSLITHTSLMSYKDNPEYQTFMAKYVGGIIYQILYIVIVVKGSDIAAYCMGKMMGERKLAPSISPNKTWEGAIGGLIVGTAAGSFFLYNLYYKTYDMFSPEYRPSILPLIILSAVVTMAAQMGDLVESAFKRWAGVKDSGRFLPEFGGFLDMVDGFLLAIPVYLLCKHVFLYEHNIVSF